MKYTKIPEDTFKNLQMNAGILCTDFDPSSGEISGQILGATTGGLTFATNPTYNDFGSDIDNCPNNTMELKKLDSFDPTISGSFLSVTANLVKMLVGAADIEDTTKIVPRTELLTTDFQDLWMVGDYSDVNTGEDAGFLAIHIMNALNTKGLEIKTTKNGKGTMSLECHGHYSMASQDVVPFEIYVKAGASA